MLGVLLYWVGVVVAGVVVAGADHVVEVGGRVSLQCGVAVQASQLCQWTRDGFGLGDTRKLSGYTRYRLVGSDDESKLLSLDISDIYL